MRASIRHSSLAVAIAAALAVCTAHAQTPDSPLVQLELPAQPLGETIRAIARLTNVNILVDSALVQGRDAPAIKTRASMEQVLKLVLEGTGLTPRYIDENTVTLQAAEASRASEPQSSTNTPEGRSGPFVFAQADTTASEPPRNDARMIAPSGEQTRLRTLELEELIVTGTHIRGVANSASPVISVGREDFARWGVTTVQEVLGKMPQNFGGATLHGTAVGGGKNGNSENANYGSSISLRGLGHGSTLVLLNGQRVAAAGQGAFVDTSSIPLSALERIDVIADGASAIYGSDAVGGVVNFILRDRFEGAETNVTYGSVTDGGLHALGVNQLFGNGWDTGAAFITLDYKDSSYLDASERGYTNALSNRPTHLVPEYQLWSALLNGYQELGDKVRLSATLYANDRDLDQIVFSPTTVTDSATSVETRQAGGTLALDWSLTPEWNINVSQTYSQADTKRGDVLMTTTGAVLSRTSSLYQVDMSVTELIADGPLFPTPGGTARLAVGGEHRAEKLEGTRRGSTQIALSRPLSLKRDVDAAFAEVNVPLVGEQNARAGMRRLDAIAAVRYEEYSDFGSTTNPKFGLVYSPVDGFDLRGTYGTSFRAPHLNQFDDSFGVGVLLQTFDTGQIVAAVTQLPSPDLGPENATTWTAGFDVHPQSAPGLAINATYFQIEYEDRIAEIPLTFTPFSNPLSRAAVSMPPDPEILAAYEFLAARDPGTVIQLGVPPGTTLADVQATFDGRRSNTAVTNVSGIDLIVSQSFDVGNHELVAGLNANYLFELTNQITRTSAPVDVVDTLYNPADLRLRSSLTWRHGAWSAAAFLNYVDAYSDLQLEQQPRRVASWTTFDASAAYTPSDRWTVRLAAINVFDKAPPHVIERIASYANAGYDSENANPIGRYVYLMLSLKW